MNTDRLQPRQLQRLHAFVEASNQLQYAVNNYLLQEVTISFDTDHPDMAPIEEFIDGIIEGGLLALMRQLVDTDENICYTGICGILKSHYKDEPLKIERIKQYKKAWNEKIVGHNSPLGIDIEGQTLMNKDLIKLLSYTGRLHTDIDKPSYRQMQNLRTSGYTPLLQLQLSGMIEGAAILAAGLTSEFIDEIITATQ